MHLLTAGDGVESWLDPRDHIDQIFQTQLRRRKLLQQIRVRNRLRNQLLVSEKRQLAYVSKRFRIKQRNKYIFNSRKYELGDFVTYLSDPSFVKMYSSSFRSPSSCAAIPSDS